ncbi:MAG: DUF2970 domain-containing protein [Paraglaciecola sp.]|uniref:DUF2970 domain-containing protein n=1 Tax=Paraglaciecola sp. TaxID=1920173 RepID=UPI003266539B
MSKNKSNLWQVFKGVAASMLGVQSHSNYESDFEQPSFIPFAIVGILFVLGLIATLILLVNVIT